MAKKQTINESTALVKKGPTEMAEWEREAMAEANADAAKFQQGTSRISFQGGNIQIDGQRIKDNKLRVAIVEAVFGKAYYEDDYDPNVKQTPVCYGFSDESADKIVPHDACPDKQHEQCVGCPHNKFGTAEKGNGKRCKDEVRIMCYVDMTGDPKGIASAEARMATIPPGSLKPWGQYIAKLRDMNLTFRTVVTEIGTEPYQGAYKLTFTPVAKLTEAQYVAIKGRRESAKQEMMQPYPVLEVEAPPKAAKRGAKSRKVE